MRDRSAVPSILLCVSSLAVFISGCDFVKTPLVGHMHSRAEPEMTGELGCETIDELVSRYEQAHKAKDLKALRTLAFWNAQSVTRRGNYDPWENAIQEIFEHPLVKVEYLALPKTDPPEKRPAGMDDAYLRALNAMDGELVYKVRGERKGASICNVLGKIVLTVDKDTSVDPSFAVVRFHDRYYISCEQVILFDAVESLKSNNPPRYVAEPLGTKMNPLEDL